MVAELCTPKLFRRHMNPCEGERNGGDELHYISTGHADSPGCRGWFGYIAGGQELYLNFCLLSAGFKIWKEHMRLSSTVIIAAALSNSPQ